MNTRTNWEEKFSKLGALWIHDGIQSHPHALLTSGKHSSGFFNATKVVENPKILERACAELSIKVSTFMGGPLPEVVVGSAFGAITIAHECTKSLGAKMAFT